MRMRRVRLRENDSRRLVDVVEAQMIVLRISYYLTQAPVKCDDEIGHQLTYNVLGYAPCEASSAEG